MKTKAEILELIEEEDIKFIRLQFTDMFGNLKNVAVTPVQLEKVLDNKYAFDSSLIFGTGKAEEDLYLCPDLNTFVILPWRPQQGKVARFLCDVCRKNGTESEISPRTILKQVIAKAEKKGYLFYIDPECEFFLFHTDENGIPTAITHEQAGYMDVAPVDLGENARREIILNLEEMGFNMESSHHENAPGQHEIDFQEGEALPIADSIVTFKSAVRSVARRFGLHATFMPKPKQGTAGSGMHLNVSVYKDGKSLFYPVDEGEICQEAKWFIGGIMEHAKAISAITNPLVNSYKRIQSGYGAPKDITWTYKNENALVKVRDRIGENTKLALRFPDPSANPYLAIAMCIAAGMEGIEQKTEPGEPIENWVDKNQSPASLPITLREAIHHMKKDELLEEILGKEFTKVYTSAKIREWNDYMTQVSDWEVEKYLYYV